MLLGTLGASLLGNILAGKGAIARTDTKETKWKRQDKGINRAGEEICWSWLWKKNEFLIVPLPLTNFEIPKYY